MLPGRFEYDPCPFADGAASEEKDHDEGMGKANFRAINQAIANRFEEDEGLFVSWIEDDFALDIFLWCYLEW